MTRHDLVAGAIRADIGADDMRAQLLAGGRLIDVDAAALADDDAQPVCSCNGVLCDAGCQVCAALDESLPCPADTFTLDVDVDVDVDDVDQVDADEHRAAGCGVCDDDVDQEDIVGDVGTPGSWFDEAPADPFPAGPPAQPSTPPGPSTGALPAQKNLEVSLPAATVAGPGWRSRHDPASLNFGVVDRLAGKAPLRDVTLPEPPQLNQGREGACVGFGVADAANVLALDAGVRDGRRLLDDAAALALYRDAQRRDEIPGEAYTGTSVLAGMKAGVAEGLFGGYLWNFGTAGIAQTLLQLRSPIVVGVPWWDAMYQTGAGGLVTGIGGGKLVGGHCLCIIGIRMRGPQGQSGPFFVWRNSWGPDYGDAGDGYVFHRDLATLLHRQGEAAVPRPAGQVPR